jgi:hypothetical protein
MRIVSLYRLDLDLTIAPVSTTHNPFPGITTTSVVTCNRNETIFEIFSVGFRRPSDSFNAYAQISSRALRQSLKENARLNAEKRGVTDLRYQKWENGNGGPQVCPPSVSHTRLPPNRECISSIEKCLPWC